MVSYVVRRGKLERDPSIDRGKMLVRSEEEWRTSLAKFKMSTARSVFNVYLPLLVLLILFQVVLWTLTPQEHPWDFLRILLIAVTLTTALAVPATWAQQIRNIEKAPAAGLYERGLQQNHQVFIPYYEIASTERRTVKGSELIEMRHRHVAKDPFWVRNPDPWTILVEFLGEDGAEELKTRVEEVHAPGSPE